MVSFIECPPCSNSLSHFGVWSNDSKTYALQRIATLHSWRHNPAMGRQPGEQISPDLFSTAEGRDASPPPSPPAPEATSEPAPQRHVLPKNLPKAVKHLSDGELDLLHTATLEEMKRRGRFPRSVSEQSSRHPSGLPTKRLPPRRHTDVPEVSLTRGQVNAVRSAFKAGITPARIARQFGISQSNVRKALASDEPKR